MEGTVERTCLLVCDREPETRALFRPTEIDLVEPFEDSIGFGGRDTRARVDDLDARMIVASSGPHGDLSPTVSHRILDEVRNDTLEARSICAHKERRIDLACQLGRGRPRLQRRVERRLQVKRFQVHGLSACIEPGELEKLEHEGMEAPNVADQQLGGSTGMRGQLIEMIPEERRGRHRAR